MQTNNEKVLYDLFDKIIERADAKIDTKSSRHLVVELSYEENKRLEDWETFYKQDLDEVFCRYLVRKSNKKYYSVMTTGNIADQYFAIFSLSPGFGVIGFLMASLFERIGVDQISIKYS